MKPVEVVIVEYKALRNEIISCLQFRIRILSYGLAAIGVLAGATVAAINAKLPVGAAIFAGLIIPIFSLFVLNIWLAETRRVRRASWHNWGIELRLEKHFGRKTLLWEEEIRKSGDRGLFFEHYGWVVGFPHAVPLISVACAVFILFGQSGPALGPYYHCVSILAFAVIVIVLLGHLGWALGYAGWLKERFDERPPEEYWNLPIPPPPPEPPQ